MLSNMRRQVAAGNLALMIAAASMTGCSNDDVEPSLNSPAYPTYRTDDVNRDGKATEEDYDLMPPAEFAKLDDRVRVADVGAKLNKFMPTAYDGLQRHLSAREKAALYMPDLAKPRSQWKDQDYLNYFSLGLYLVTTQGTQQIQIDEGRRALTVVMSPDHGNFSAMNTSVGTANGVKSVYEAQPSPYSGRELSSNSSASVLIGGEGGRLVFATFVPGSPGAAEAKQYMLFVNRSDNTGNVVSMLAGSYTSLTASELKGIR